MDINKLQLPENPDLAKQVLQAHQDTRSKEIEGGVFGKLFGFATEKPGNIAGFAIVVSIVALIAILLWMPDSESISKKDAATLFAGIITLALGFVFGRSSAGGN